ncbi:unnamed protein product [Urochloa humidicola]
MAAITGGRALIVAALLCTMAVMAAAVPWPTSIVHAPYIFYSPEEKEWDLRSVNNYCAQWDADNPLWWRKKYGWVTLCEPWDTIPDTPGYCGSCIKITNRATGAWILGRIMNKCSVSAQQLGYHGLELDYDTVFSKVDTDGQGFENGYLKVDYQWVSCW